MKYAKYYISTCLVILAIFICSGGRNYPTYFFLSFSVLIILGDLYLDKDLSIEKYGHTRLVNLPIYINFPFLLIYLIEIIFILGNHEPGWLIDMYSNYLSINLMSLKNELTILDKISLIAVGSLYIGIIGTVPGHELTHRKKDWFDMFFGNWLLSISWDCAFALEHSYGHHKNVGLTTDPATAKRGENIYIFILRATVKEHLDAWNIEFSYLKRRSYNPFSLHNKMIIGYVRSLSITYMAYLIGGIYGMMFYLLCAFIAKALLEVINYIEHYGLVREPNKPVRPRHSWNANHVISSLLLYNVTRHSAHHEKSTLHFWELDPYQEAPMMPYGYLTMLYIAIFLPFLFHRIMKKKLIEWDQFFATEAEREIAMIS